MTEHEQIVRRNLLDISFDETLISRYKLNQLQKHFFPGVKLRTIDDITETDQDLKVTEQKETNEPTRMMQVACVDTNDDPNHLRHTNDQ